MIYIINIDQYAAIRIVTVDNNSGLITSKSPYRCSLQMHESTGGFKIFLFIEFNHSLPFYFHPYIKLIPFILSLLFVSVGAANYQTGPIHCMFPYKYHTFWFNAALVTSHASAQSV